jgi:lysophospholipase L1-like esterase
MSWREPRRLLALSALILAGIAAALVVGEMVARLAMDRPARQPLAVRPEGIVYRKNSLGFRGREYAEHPAAGTFRIVVGDSIVLGAGVAEENTYSSLLETELQRTSSGTKYEVLNLGVPGFHIRAVMRRLETLGLRLEPDLVVYGWTVNDIEGPAYRTFATPELTSRHVAEALRFANSPSYLLRVLRPRWVSLRDAFYARPGSYLYDLRHNYFDNERAWSDFVAGLDRFSAAVRDRGICGHVVIHADLNQLNFLHPLTAIYGRVAVAAGERGLTVTDSFPYFRGHDPKSLHVAPFNPHPNATGHRILTRALLDGLQSLPSRCWEQAERRPSRTAGPR